MEALFDERVCPGKEMMARVLAMLTRLVDRFDAQEFRVREDAPSFSLSIVLERVLVLDL